MSGLSYDSFPHEIWHIIIGFISSDCINQIFELPLKPEWNNLVHLRYFRNIKLGKDFDELRSEPNVRGLDARFLTPEEFISLTEYEKSFIKYLDCGCSEVYRKNKRELLGHLRCDREDIGAWYFPWYKEFCKQVESLSGVTFSISCARLMWNYEILDIIWSSIDLVTLYGEELIVLRGKPDAKVTSFTICCESILSLYYHEFFEEILGKFVELKTLDLSVNFETDIPNLSPFIHLEKLILHTRMELDLSSLESLPKLRTLEIYLSNFSFRSLSRLVNLENLKLDSLSHDQVIELDSLTNLKSLEVINSHKMTNIAETNLRYSPSWDGIDNLDLLGGQFNLQSLNLSHNMLLCIRDFGQGQLGQLKCLDLSFNMISNIDILQGLVNLEYLDLSDNQITNIESLETLCNLKYLSLSSNEVQTIPTLSAMVNLEELDLGHNKITVISNLDKLVNLRVLNLSNNNVLNSSGLGSLVSLRELNLSGNQITEIKILSNLTQLRSLSIGENNISKIKNLDTLVNLQDLDLLKNKILQMEGIGGLFRMKRLNLSDNRITEIEHLDKLTRVTNLNLRRNEILTIKNLNTIENLEELDLSNNKILKIENLSQHVELKALYLRNNLITELEGLDKCDKLKRLTLLGNKIPRDEIEEFQEERSDYSFFVVE